MSYSFVHQFQSRARTAVLSCSRHGAHGSSHHLPGGVAIGRRRAPKHRRLAQRRFSFWIEFLGVQKKVRVSGHLVGHLEVGVEDRLVEQAAAGQGEEKKFSRRVAKSVNDRHWWFVVLWRVPKYVPKCGHVFLHLLARFRLGKEYCDVQIHSSSSMHQLRVGEQAVVGVHNVSDI